VQRAQSSVDAAVSAAKELKSDDPQQQSIIVALNKSLFDAKNELRDAQAQIVDLDEKVDEQTDLLNAANDEKNAAITARDAANSHVHKLKFLVCSLAAAATGLLVFQFRRILALLGPYGLIAYVAVPGLVFGALWMRL
jgi:predicted  nucleic acid-binding Zn-ribbon protein